MLGAWTFCSWAMFLKDESWHSNVAPSRWVIQSLVRSASGLFTWAVTACHSIIDRSDRDSAASPEQHNQLHLIVLQISIQGSYTARELEKYSSRMRQILGSLVALSSPLSVSSLGMLIQVPEQRVNQMLKEFHTKRAQPTTTPAPPFVS